MIWQRLAQARIESAILSGEFDGLPGAGRPLDLSDDAIGDPGLRVAFHLLKGAGLAPAWIEVDGDIRREMDAARRELRQRGAGADARRRFDQRVAEVNRMIDRLNLIVPALFLQRAHRDAEREARLALEGREKRRTGLTAGS